MSAHTKLHSKADFDKALETQGRYVLIHAYSGSVLDKAEEFAAKYKSNCDAYAVDTSEEPKVMEYFGITQTPAALLYKDGQQVKKVEGRGSGIEDIESLLKQ
ncbi:uncharacterized protein LTR77_007976 [Saxophila tyrrhenica]|uniref:Thioredoxin domain-containing protein n=1 Tax=Saxophila tyrrhenica TaxID=1690608 RepID=A0AAV9P4F9_9PEZI|nr:hypothetical protein LTR77_007976 [Saxophila tyrrhenica]